MGIMKR